MHRQTWKRTRTSCCNRSAQKILAVIEKYARDNGYTMVVDVSSPQTPVLYASPSIDITKEIIELYDKNTAGGRQRHSAPARSQGSCNDIDSQTTGQARGTIAALPAL